MKKVVLGVGVGAVVVATGVVIWFFASSGIDEETAQVTAPTLAPTATTAGPSETSGVPATVFALAEGTTVSFEFAEELRGEFQRVMASNTEVAGQLSFDRADLSTVQLGDIVIGAQTFTSDSGNRDRAIRGPVLDASTFPEIVFKTSSVDGLTGTVEIGQELTFSVTGDLTIREVTRMVTFEVKAKLAAPDRLEGTASTTVLRSDFGLQIPSVPSVANVSDEVLIAMTFVALPA